MSFISAGLVAKHTPLRRLATLASSSGLVGGRLQAGLLLPAAGRASSSSTLPSQLAPSSSSSSAIPRSSSLIQHARTFSTPPPPPLTPSPTSLTPPVPPTKPRSLLSKIFRLGLVFNALSITLVVLGGGSLWVYYSYVVPAKTVYKRGKDGLTYAVGAYETSKGWYSWTRGWYGYLFLGERGSVETESADERTDEVVRVREK